MTRAVVVVNPLSGRGRYDNQIQAHAALADQILTAHGYRTRVRPTAARGDARRFAQEAVADATDLVVAWGGDGTVNEVASALVGSRVPLAIVPAGSGNGLAADLGLPFEARRALEVAARGETRPIDAGRVNGAYFFNIAGIGLDARIATRFAGRGLRRRGPLAYLQLTSAELFQYRSTSYDIECDGERWTVDAILIAVANGRQYGNRVVIAPEARLDDGRFELVIVEPQSWWGIVRRLPSLFRGRLRAGDGVSMRPAAHVRIRAAGTIPFHVDGEPGECRDTVEIGLNPQALLVRTTSV
jgi:YegS/Rv2252/BmrU family lipid kinase